VNSLLPGAVSARIISLDPSVEEAINWHREGGEQLVVPQYRLGFRSLILRHSWFVVRAGEDVLPMNGLEIPLYSDHRFEHLETFPSAKHHRAFSLIDTVS
jgi:hypothetical protein